MDTLPIGGPQGTDVPGIPPSTSQPDLAVPDEPTSEMVGGKLDDTALDKQIMDEFSSTLLSTLLDMDMKRVLKATLASLLTAIAEQNNLTIKIWNAEDMLEHHEWLWDFLIKKWQERSFSEVRRLSECPLCQCAFPVNKFMQPDFRSEILQPVSTTLPSPSEEAAMSGPGRLPFSKSDMLLTPR